MSLLPTTFHLKRGDTVLAVMENCGLSGEMFWQLCDFMPTAAFSEVKELFERISQTEDVDVINQTYDTLRDMGIVLVDVEANQEIRYFMVHVDEGKAFLRAV